MRVYLTTVGMRFGSPGQINAISFLVVGLPIPPLDARVVEISAIWSRHFETKFEDELKSNLAFDNKT